MAKLPFDYDFFNLNSMWKILIWFCILLYGLILAIKIANIIFYPSIISATKRISTRNKRYFLFIISLLVVGWGIYKIKKNDWNIKTLKQNDFILYLTTFFTAISWLISSASEWFSDLLKKFLGDSKVLNIRVENQTNKLGYIILKETEKIYYSIQNLEETKDSFVNLGLGDEKLISKIGNKNWIKYLINPINFKHGIDVPPPYFELDKGESISNKSISASNLKRIYGLFLDIPHHIYIVYRNMRGKIFKTDFIVKLDAQNGINTNDFPMYKFLKHVIIIICCLIIMIFLPFSIDFQVIFYIRLLALIVLLFDILWITYELTQSNIHPILVKIITKRILKENFFVAQLWNNTNRKLTIDFVGFCLKKDFKQKISKNKIVRISSNWKNKIIFPETASTVFLFEKEYLFEQFRKKNLTIDNKICILIKVNDKIVSSSFYLY